MSKKIHKAWKIGNTLIEFRYEPKSDLGRFGGGWNYHLGIIAGRGCMIAYFLVAELRFTNISDE